MNKVKIGLGTLMLGIIFSGCGAYRTESGITPPDPDKFVKPAILVTINDLSDKNCTTIAPVKTTIKKLTAMHSNPTKNQANFILAEKGKKLGANAVRNVRYSSGVGFTTWGYIEGNGEASKCDLD